MCVLARKVTLVVRLVAPMESGGNWVKLDGAPIDRKNRNKVWRSDADCFPVVFWAFTGTGLVIKYS